MGTKTKSRRSRRASRRGLASFVSFLLLFAFALGQSSLSALADDAGTSPATAEEAGSDGTTLPVAEAPAEEAPAEEAPAEEAPAEEAPAEEAPATDAPADPSNDGAASASVSSSARKLHVARVSSEIARPAAAPVAGLSSGDISLDFVAAGPFTYNHVTGLGSPPQFGYDNRTISKTNGVVESLEGGDFECGDFVTFFVQVKVAGDAAGSGDVELDMSFGNETTGQPGIGFDNIMSVAINTPDGGNVGLDGDEAATLSNEHLDTQGYDEVKGTVTVTNLDPGETAIVRIIVRLACEIGTPTGNILNAIDAARVVGDGTINVGQETVPMKQVGDVAQPGMNVDKTCPASAAIGDTITYSISIENTGNEQLDIASVVDTVDGHAGVNITASFPSSVAAGTTVTRTYAYTVLASDPDPLPNSVSVSAMGHISTATVIGSASCQTDITHVPGIQVVKECPQTVAFGDDVTYTITVTNTGNEALENVLVSDALLGGDITAAFNLADPFPVGGTASAEFTYTPAADEDPVANSVTASGDGVDSGINATASDTCTTNITHVPGIDVTKSCPETVAFGEDITYTITVTNTGNEALENVIVSDALLGGDITAAFNLADPFPVGGTASAEFTYTPAADEDPVANSVTASGDGVDSGTPVTDTAVCSTDVSNPGISILKTVDEEIVPIGTTVTFTYVVTNTGDVTLFNISVDDDILGHIGDIASLDPGEDATLTKDFVVGDEIVTNIGTAVGHDILGREVSASDDATVAPIAGENPPPNNPPTTPFTGSDAGRLGLITMVLFGIGVTVVASTRRRRPNGEAA